jgi:hypothetical protein
MGRWVFIGMARIFQGLPLRRPLPQALCQLHSPYSIRQVTQARSGPTRQQVFIIHQVNPPPQPYQTNYPSPDPRSHEANANSKPSTNQEARAPSESPSPPDAMYYPHWDAAIRAFLARVGLTQALRGFELDMLVMNSKWERSEVPAALKDLVENVSVCNPSVPYVVWSVKHIPAQKLDEMTGCHGVESLSSEQRLLDDRKLDYVQSASGIKPQSHASVSSFGL